MSMGKKKKNGWGKKHRAVIVSGVRTPFVKAFGRFLNLDSIDLADRAVQALLERTELPYDEIDSIIWGGVILPSGAPNIGREVALDLHLPPSVEAMTCTRACATGLQAVTLAAAAIERGEADVVIAGGSDSTSNAPINLPQKAVHALAPIAFGKASTASDYLGVLAQMMPITEILPKMPKIAERTTGEVMGESAESMARRNEISREAQDRFAERSHHRAAAAIASGRFDIEVAPVETPEGWVHADNIVRGDTSVEKLSQLRPVFARNGTVTAGNASPLTDGAAAVLLMSAEKADALGYKPLAAFRSWAYVGVDPADQLLIGPAIAMPKALDRAGMELKDVDLVDIHEAFAAQVLSVTKALASKGFAELRLGRNKAVGEIDEASLNVHGGSLSIGHPFGATGARMVTTMANELALSKKETALLGICAAGGIGAAAVLEAVR
jgi:acetyl-CoA acyltransferase